MDYESYKIIAEQCGKMSEHCRKALVPLVNVRPTLRTIAVDNQITYWRNCISAYRWMAALAWQQVGNKDGRQPESI